MRVEQWWADRANGCCPAWVLPGLAVARLGGWIAQTAIARCGCCPAWLLPGLVAGSRSRLLPGVAVARLVYCLAVAQCDGATTK